MVAMSFSIVRFWIERTGQYVTDQKLLHNAAVVHDGNVIYMVWKFKLA